VVLPSASLKIYLDASPETRARRRTAELAARGTPRPYGDVLAELRERDRLDSQRSDSPLRPADDAVRIRTDGLSEGQGVAQSLDLCGGLGVVPAEVRHERG